MPLSVNSSGPKSRWFLQIHGRELFFFWGGVTFLGLQIYLYVYKKKFKISKGGGRDARSREWKKPHFQSRVIVRSAVAGPLEIRIPSATFFIYCTSSQRKQMGDVEMHKAAWLLNKEITTQDRAVQKYRGGVKRKHGAGPLHVKPTFPIDLLVWTKINGDWRLLVIPPHLEVWRSRLRFFLVLGLSCFSRCHWSIRK